MQALFAATLFLSAFLLFLVQPLVGRMLLPLLGGTPAVWNTCMVFFQAALLAGYAYSHAVSTRLPTRSQVMLHAGLLLLPAFFLPVAVSDHVARAAADAEHPVFLLLKILFLAVGLPFFVVSTTGPLLQRWFGKTGHAAAADPYFLYSASNFGSMLALLCYPALFEPLLRIADQSTIWTAAYGLFVIFVIGCGVALWRTHDPAAPPPVRVHNPDKSAIDSFQSAVGWRRRVRWVLLAFVPSSLLLGTTTYLSTDLSPIPLLWVVPLAIYLLTFILVFAKKPPLPHTLVNRLFPIAVILLTLVLLTGAAELRGLPAGVLLALHLVTFFLAAMVGHGELARDRPSADHLTEFYLWLSVGGVLGGLFNALLAPVLFQNVGLAEYPLALVLACFLRSPRPTRQAPEVDGRKIAVTKNAAAKNANPGSQKTSAALAPAETGWNNWDLLIPAAIGAETLGMIFLASRIGLEIGPLRTALIFGLPCVLVYVLVEWPIRFGFGIAALFLAGAVDPDHKLQHLERNFFGVLRVAETETPEGARFRALYHGNTIHGQQDLEHVDADGRHEPLTYYHATGPIGRVFENWLKPRPAGQRVGIVGLGTGSMAWFAREGDDFTYYEIDPKVKRIAEDKRFFTFLSECRARSLKIVLGDARLRLRDVPDKSLNMLVLDAFSSDAIPMHLLTKEAMQLYVDKLADGGIMAFHVSNRYLSIQPIVGKLAESMNPPLVARHWNDRAADPAIGKLVSQWVVLARTDAVLGSLADDVRWQKIHVNAKTPLWTDDFHNLLSAFEW